MLNEKLVSFVVREWKSRSRTSSEWIRKKIKNVGKIKVCDHVHL
jgi:hypothetical protein